MIEIAQSNLVTLIAGAVLTSALLGFASYEHALSQDLAIDVALDALAVEVAGAVCSAPRPAATVGLAPMLAAFPPSVANITLFPNHIRAVGHDRSGHASIEFPALPLAAPVELKGKSSLHFAWDLLLERCSVTVS